MTQPPRSIICIGGLDTSGGAGAAADIRIAAALRVPCQIALAALAPQDAAGVHQVFPIPAGAFRAQLRSLNWDSAAALKLGMIYLPELLEILLEEAPPKLSWIIDPVLSASSGGALAVPGLEDAMEARAFPRAGLITMNRDEAAHFARDFPDLTAARELAPQLAKRFDCAVLLKGGHLVGEPVDVLADSDGRLYEYPGKRGVVACRGTGCALSTAVACGLAVGRTLHEAVAKAKELINRAVEGAYPGPAGAITAP